MKLAIANLAKQDDGYGEQAAGEILKVYKRSHHPSYKAPDQRRKRPKVAVTPESDTDRERAQDAMDLPIVKADGCQEKVKR